MALAAAVHCRGWRAAPPAARLPDLGVPVGPYLQQAEPATLAAFWQQVDRLRHAGLAIWQVAALADIERLATMHIRLISAEFAQEHAALYRDHASLYRPRTVELVEAGKKVGRLEQAEGRSSASRLRHELEVQMSRSGIDLWITPAALGPAPEGIHATGDPAMNLPWTHAGMPAIALPAGRATNGLPLGIQLVAPFGADEQLLAWAQMLSGEHGLPGTDGHG